MSLLTPLGLLGLIGLAVLIIIYIIKPIFQNKIISSTYVWKKSLQYRKKKIPISQLRNILIFICQVFIITLIAIILAQPYLKDEDADTGESTVLIIDASASMHTGTSDANTRFKRAVEKASSKVDELLSEEDARVSIILASNEPYFVVQEANADSKAAVKNALNNLVYVSEETNNNACTYGTPDIPSAIKLSEEVTAYNTNSKVILYTDTQYIDKGKIEIVDVKEDGEWNAAILDVRSKIVEGYYVFEVDVACYGKDEEVEVSVNFFGVNYENDNLPTIVKNVKCYADETKTIVFSAHLPEGEFDESLNEQVNIYEFTHVQVSLNENDHLSKDNIFFLYGGKRPTLRVQYKSTAPNNFYASALMVLKDRLGDYWDIKIDQVQKTDENYATTGYDIYIFEHMVPSTIPTDGIVILSDPTALPSKLGIQLGREFMYNEGQPLENAENHPTLNNISAERIELTKYKEISNYDDYTPLFTCQDKVVAAIKNTEEEKIVVLSFNMHFSNVPLLPEFPLFMYNLLNYFTPMTFDGFVYDVNSTVDLNARADKLGVTSPSTALPTVDIFPYTLTLTEPGVYTVTQELISGEPVSESFYVKISSDESNITLVKDEIENPYFYVEPESGNLDLLLYLAMALVAFLFIEWWLHTREQY